MYHIQPKQCHSPCSALTCILHNGNRCVHGCGHNSLSGNRCLEKASMTGNSVKSHFLILKENIKTYFQGCNRTVYIGLHKIGNVKCWIRLSYYKRPALVKARNMLAGKIIACNYSATIGTAFKSLGKKCFIHLAGIHLKSHTFCKIHEKSGPRVNIGCAVIAMHHGNGTSIRRRNHIKLFVKLLKLFIEYNHCKYGCSGRHVSGSYTDCIRSCHSRSGIPLRWA